MFRRFALATIAFIALIVPGTFGLALLAAPAAPAPVVEPPGCERHLKDAGANVAAMQARLTTLTHADAAQKCNATRLYFLEVVKARAVTALCKRGADRDRELGRLDADVEHINGSIAAQCH
jgi:hypothetical protein